MLLAAAAAATAADAGVDEARAVTHVHYWTGREEPPRGGMTFWGQPHRPSGLSFWGRSETHHHHHTGRSRWSDWL